MSRSISDASPLTECEPLVHSALAFATLILRYSDSLYPFGLLSIAGDVQPVMSEQPERQLSGVIEEIEWLIFERSFQTPYSASVIVYLADVENDDGSFEDVIFTRIKDERGTEISRLYPYALTSSGVVIGKPYCI